MRQVIVIHGGDSYASYEAYIEALRAAPIALEPRKGWKSGLQEVLGEGYAVIQPRMPNAQNARYLEWKLWFEKYLPLLDPELILVGHSLGGAFLAKYLSEQRCEKHIVGTCLVAAPFDDPAEENVDFNVTGDLALFRAQGGKIVLYHSTDDDIVPYAAVERYRTALPEAHVRSFTDRGHFIGQEFPELVTDIRTLG